MSTTCLKNPAVSARSALQNRSLREAGLLATTALVSVWSPAALAQSSGPVDVPLDVMFDLGALEQGAEAYSYAIDVSANGNVVIGESRVNISENNWQYHAFIWKPEEGMVDLGTLGGTYSSAYDLSRDGSVVVG